MTTRMRRWLVIAVAALAAVLALIAIVVWRSPVTIGDKRLLLDFLLGRGVAPPSAAEVDRHLSVPAGFRLELYSDAVPLARFMVATDGGHLLVTRTRAGAISILDPDRDGDGRADAHRILLEGLDRPHGIALQDGWLYVAQRTSITRARFDAENAVLAGPLEPVMTGLTGSGFHQTKTIGFGPDGWLYLSQGSTCNVCIEEDPRRATIMRMRADGSDAEIFATGLRNSVGFDWSPWDGALYATENGRDLLGDDRPPDELNRIEQGGFYGWPFVHGTDVADPEFGDAYDGTPPVTPPVHEFRAHNAPLGISFLDGGPLPAGYDRAALVALHGSWNRSTPDGYKVVSLHWQPDGRIVERDFLTGFLNPEGIIGRPAGVIQAADGSVFVSDDYAGAIYRIVPAMPSAQAQAAASSD